GDIYRTWFEQRGFGKDYRVVDGDYVLSPGQECPRTHNELGHTISMNIKNMIRNTEQYYLYDTVFDEAHRQGGLSGYAHVNSGIFFVHRDMSINIPKEKIDFVELLQFANLGTDLYYDFLNTGFKVTASAGSDVPWGGSVGEVRVYAYTGKKRFNADRWFEAVRRGNTFVTNGIMLDFRVDKAIPGDEILVDDDRPLRVYARAWGDPERCVPSRLDVVVHGDSIESIEPSSADEAELVLDFEVPPGNGFWIAARAEGSDGSRAHTTPIYVIREGLRFWKYEGIEDLIAKRETSLSEIEQIVAEAIAQNDAGAVNDNRPIQQLALQGPDLLDRVRAAREIYAGLRETARLEAALRR
ncbi:MAG: CehA/McbA family metallohydrolase, partial [Candidatus Hydrogenedentes bacterium]|nr:CehA/McbA family metallohydrolase [Candidatus Hydrogenedentota bacterium]